MINLTIFKDHLDLDNFHLIIKINFHMWVRL